jgi:hypothetical protein
MMPQQEHFVAKQSALESCTRALGCKTIVNRVGRVKSSYVPKKRSKRIHFSLEHELEARPARIVSEPERVYMRDGKLIPLVVIDTHERPDIDSLFASYTPETIGDVAIQWGRRDGAPKGTVTLNIQFIAPVKQFLMLDFEIVRQGLVVDGILRTRELYLQGLRSGGADTQVQSPKVRVVVPDTGFGSIWEELLIRELAQRSKALGASEQHARFLAQESIRRWRTGPS